MKVAAIEMSELITTFVAKIPWKLTNGLKPDRVVNPNPVQIKVLASGMATLETLGILVIV